MINYFDSNNTGINDIQIIKRMNSQLITEMKNKIVFNYYNKNTLTTVKDVHLKWVKYKLMLKYSDEYINPLNRDYELITKYLKDFENALNTLHNTSALAIEELQTAQGNIVNILNDINKKKTILKMLKTRHVILLEKYIMLFDKTKIKFINNN